MHLGGIHAGAGIRILVTGRTLREDDRSTVRWRCRSADIGPIGFSSKTVSVRTIRDGEGSPGLECGNPCNRPPTQCVFPEARRHY